nr:FdhF/YdeP family oxidoreductase [Hyphomonas sp. Mor2]
MATQPIGGGSKKILYTLNTVRRIGLLNSAKALTAKNACKACALGMGGQMGGMTNELGEFPSVCNKSVQAQSTDIQPPIPTEVFEHSLSEFRELSPRELENLGRLNTPIYKPSEASKFFPIGWDEAIKMAATRLADTKPDRSFFYSSGRSSNEAGFLFQLIARLYGTNNVTNCSYYCHQATSVALGSTIGTGTATVELADIGQCDTILVIGANPSSNHPRFIHQLKKCRDRGGQVIVINPAKEPGLVKFAIPKSPKSLLAGGSDIASVYVQPNIGGDIALFKGIAKSIIARDRVNQKFVNGYTQGWGSFAEDIVSTGWNEICGHSGLQRQEIEEVAERIARSELAIFAWGMGMTHHTHGVENIEMIANIALMCGMIGKPGAGLLPLRGHSNVQGVGTIGVKPVLAEDVIKKIESWLEVELPDGEGMDTMASMQAASRNEIDTAVIMGGNLYAANPNSQWAARALDQIDFKLFLTTTLNQGHIMGGDRGETLILPVCARDEEWEPTTQESMFNFVRLSDGGISRLTNVRPETKVLADIASQLLTDTSIEFEAFARHQNLRNAIAEVVPGMEELADIEIAKKEFHIANRILHEPQFYTPSGKAQFRVCAIPKQSGKKRSFALSTLRSEGQFNSIIYEIADSYRRVPERWAILMNKEDMRRLKLKAGEKANVTSDQGEMRGVTVYEFDVPAGNILAYYPEGNILTGTEVDPRSRTPAFKNTRVDIEPARQAVWA